MKKALLLAALAALLATSAWASELWVITPVRPSGGDQRSLNDYVRFIEQRLKSDGVAYRMLKATDLTTPEAAALSMTRGGVTYTGSALMILSFQANTYTGGVSIPGDDYPAPATGVYPNWLTKRSRYWPSKPTLFVGVWRIPSADMWTTSDSCSTMVTGALSAFGAQTPGEFYRSAYVTGRPWAWKTAGQNPLPLLASSAARGSVRPLVQTAMSGSTWNLATTCTDCDGMTRAAADSALMWRVSPVTATGAETGVPLFFVWPTAAGMASWSDGMFANAVAALDSAVRAMGTGEKIIGSDVSAQWGPTKIALVVSNAGRHTTGTAAETDAGGGITLVDSTVYKGSQDSLATLGVPINVHHLVDPDTLALYPNELAWWKTRAPLAKFMPFISRGANNTTAVGASGNTSSSTPIDPFGRNRTRYMGDSVATSSCVADTTYYCQLRSLLQAGFAAFGTTRTLRTLRPPVWDMIPNQYGYRTLPDADSLHYAAYRAGFRSYITNPSLPENSPGSEYNQTNSSLLYSPQLSTLGALQGNSGSRTIYNPSTRQRAGNMRYLATRAEGAIELQSVNLIPSSHKWSDEFLTGNVRSKAGGVVWYPNDYYFYRHNFRTALDVFEMPASLLHGTAGATRRFAWWQYKWIVNQVKAENYFAGRTVRTFVYTDDL